MALMMLYAVPMFTISLPVSCLPTTICLSILEPISPLIAVSASWLALDYFLLYLYH